MDRRSSVPRWWWLLPSLASVRIVAWLLLGGWVTAPQGALASTALVLLFGGSGGLLISVGRPQPTPVRLGAIFLLTGGALVDEAAFLAAGGGPLTALAGLRPGLFLPAFFWRLAEDFPRLPHAEARSVWAPRLAGISLIVCSVPFLGTLVARRRIWDAFDTGMDLPPFESIGWACVYLLSLAALAHMAWRSRRASVAERRRVRLFLGGIIIGSSPALLGSLVLLASPTLLALLRSDPRYEAVFLAAAFAGLAIVPLVTFHAVLVHHALGLRGAARSTIRALLARQTGWILVASPLLAAVGLLLSPADGPFLRLGPSTTLVVVTCVALGVLTLTRRTQILSFVDRHFFPDLHRIDEDLDALLGGLASCRSTAELAAAVNTAVTEILGLRSGHLLLFDADRASLQEARGEIPPLDVAPGLATRLGRGGLVPLAPEDDESRDWGGRTGIHGLVSMGAADEKGTDPPRPLGAIGVGRPRSGLPSSPIEERRLVRLAREAGRVVARLAAETPTRGVGLAADPTLAGRCPRCGRIGPVSERTCDPCGTALVALELPYILSGRYRIESRLGSGGLGVVYEGRDLALDRSVALKTLPTASPHRVSELRREARFMGRLSHPALATIHGLEIWRGVPVLILEYFGSGTLHDRLGRGPIPWREALEIGMHLASGLGYLHGKGAIHGDVKPRNIGIPAEGDMKIMDFGISRLVGDVAEPSLESIEKTPTDASSAGRLKGTAIYLPPEILDDRADAGPNVDLWALSVTLFESVAGRHPFRGATLSSSVAKILLGDAPDLGTMASWCPPEVVRFFRSALAQDERMRPGTAEGWIQAARPLLDL